MSKRILASLIIVGLVAATVGNSTVALLNDQETSSENTFSTGEIDLTIDWNESYNGENVERQEFTDNPGPIFNFTDLKPGDHGEATVSIHLEDNPGWVWMRGIETKDEEVVETESETSMGDTDPDGELDDELIFTIWRDDGDNVLEDGEEVIEEGSLRSMQDSLEDGLLLGEFDSSETEYIGIKWEIPRDVGNRIQKDIVEIEYDFYAEQRRHNDNPENPWTG